MDELYVMQLVSFHLEEGETFVGLGVVPNSRYVIILTTDDNLYSLYRYDIEVDELDPIDVYRSFLEAQENLELEVEYYVRRSDALFTWN